MPVRSPETVESDPGLVEPKGRVLELLGPAGLSLFGHAILVFFLSFVTWAAGSTRVGSDSEFTARLVARTDQDQPAGGFRFPGRAQADRPDSRESDEAIQDLASLLKREQALQLAPIEAGQTGLTTLAVDQLSRSDVVGTSAVTGEAGEGLGAGLGDRDFAGGGPVGTLWGVGKGQQARSIVYVMDRSGSMSDTIESLKRELKRAIGSLEPDQLFNVIWFNEGKAEEWSPRLRKATIDNKREAFAAISHVIATGETHPIDAIRRSLAYGPDVVFLLSDGDFGDDNQRVIELIRQRPRHQRPVINTILFVYDTMGDGERVLRSIAELSHGVYKHVTEQDIAHR